MQKKVNRDNECSLDNALSRKHICLFYGSNKDLLDLVVPYFKEGLRNNELCIWAASKTLGVDGAKKALSKAVLNINKYIKKGQLEIIDCKKWYLDQGKFNSDKVLNGWLEKEKQALKQGFNGMRVSGDASWLQKRDWNKWVNYERTLDNIIDKHKIAVLCTYPLGKYDLSNMFIMCVNHRFAFSNKGNRWHILKNVKLNNLLFNIKYFLDEYKQKRK